MTNVTGWNELMTGNVINASFHMFNTATDGWLIVGLFITYQMMAYIKTRNPGLRWLTGMFFGALFFTSDWIPDQAIITVGTILVIELAAILYSILKT